MTPLPPLRLLAVLAPLLLLMQQPAGAETAALPFDPQPSAFQAWLNARRDWPEGEQPRFSGLARCSDQTVVHSPYRTPSYTCLQGSVSQLDDKGVRRSCPLRRVSYLPASGQVRYWLGSCR
jgi:hypothetical protein